MDEAPNCLRWGGVGGTGGWEVGEGPVLGSEVWGGRVVGLRWGRGGGTGGWEVEEEGPVLGSEVWGGQGGGSEVGAGWGAGWVGGGGGASFRV